MKGVYEGTKRLCNEGPKRMGMVKSKEGRKATDQRKGDGERTLWRPEQVSS